MAREAAAGGGFTWFVTFVDVALAAGVELDDGTVAAVDTGMHMLPPLRGEDAVVERVQNGTRTPISGGFTLRFREQDAGVDAFEETHTLAPGSAPADVAAALMALPGVPFVDAAYALGH